MANEEEYEDTGAAQEHPADKTVNGTAVGFKHVLGKALKFALIGAIIGAVLFAAVPAMLGYAGLTALPWFLAAPAAFFGITTGFAAGTIGSAALSGALMGGGIAAAIGGILGISSAGEAVADAKEDARANYDRAIHRQRQLAALRLRDRQQNVAMAKMERQYGLPAVPRDRLPAMPRDRGRRGQMEKT